MILDFKVEGMTCVACSRTIESAMITEFKHLGLKSVQIALLTHKMRMVFDLGKYIENEVNPEKISEEVLMIGFTAELIEMIENNQEELLRKRQMSMRSSDSRLEIEISPN